MVTVGASSWGSGDGSEKEDEEVGPAGHPYSYPLSAFDTPAARGSPSRQVGGGCSSSCPGPCSPWGSPAGPGDAHCSQSEGWVPVSGDLGGHPPYNRLGWQTGCVEGLEPRGGSKGNKETFGTCKTVLSHKFLVSFLLIKTRGKRVAWVNPN